MHKFTRNALLALFLLGTGAYGQERIDGWPMPGPALAGESEGPFARLIIEGGMLVDGTGAPPIGPVTIVVEKNRIAKIYGLPGLYTPQLGKSGRPEIGPGDRHIDARGSFILPGLIETMARILDRSPVPDAGNQSRDTNPPPEYTLKLLIAHGVTTTTSMQSTYQFDWVNALKKAAAENRITAPRILAWMDFPAATPEEARARVREAKKRGADGFGEGDMEGPLAAMLAGLDEARKVGLPTIFCMHPNTTERYNVLEFARAGLKSLPHAWGLPDALLKDSTVRRYPPNYNYSDGAIFMRSGRGWQDTVEPHSEPWNKMIDELISLDFTMTPTFSVFEAHRDFMAARGAEWNADYAHPALYKDWLPESGGGHAYFADWSTADEVNWKRDFRLWMTLVNEYKNRGGRVVAGSDPGYIWTVPGFALVRNLELLQEAGFHPLEAIRAATYDSAVWLQIADRTGSVEVGKQADLLIVDGNPLANFKLLYGTGVVGRKSDGSYGRVGGVRYTIRDGVVYDAKAVLANVRKIVEDARSAAELGDALR
jgi:cytosine/adenosine deaminase-related metal-dependent hydrolase